LSRSRPAQHSLATTFVFITSKRFAGASVLIGRRGEIAYFETRGVADKATGNDFAKDSIVRIYSMTKPVTSVAAMMLYAPPSGGDMSNVGRTSGATGEQRGVGLKLQESAASSASLKPVKLFSGGGGLMSTMWDYARFCQMLANRGELDGQRLHHWGGAASTFFWLDAEEELFVIFLTQLIPSSTYPIRRELRSQVYQALVD